MANALKAGRVDNFAGSLASYIDTAMQNEWLAVKGEPLPGGDQGSDDRKILFAAIAQGVLKFLVDHGNDLITSDETADGDLTPHHHTMAFTVNDFRTPLP